VEVFGLELSQNTFADWLDDKVFAMFAFS